MVVAPDGTVAGSVSGGCVEAAVYELAHDVVASGRPELQRYGVSDDDAFAIGLTCGGIIAGRWGGGGHSLTGTGGRIHHSGPLSA
jgi:xanthine/CO dehydrogenase XdhC/CoxF family maturation factor